MAEIVGLCVGVVSLVIKVFDKSRQTLETTPSTLEKEITKEQGPSGKKRDANWAATFLGWLLPSFQPQIENINSLLSKDSDDLLLRFRDSYITDCNMTAVAAAIMAQVALTSLVFPALSQTHWVVRGTFVASLVAGATSVYFAVIAQKLVAGLSTPGDLRAWLSIPLKRKFLVSIGDLEYHHQAENTEELRKVPSGLVDPEESAQLDAIEAALFKTRFIPRETSISAVLVLGSASILLGMALSTYLLALGLYLLFIWTKSLDPLATQEDSRNVFIFYISATLVMLLFFSIPLGIKKTEYEKEKLYSRILQRIYWKRKPAFATGNTGTFLQGNTIQPQTPAISPSFERLSQVLAKAIEAQEAVLKANQELAAELVREKMGRVVPQQERWAEELS